MRRIAHPARRQGQRGVTLIELMLGIGVVIVVIGVGVAIYQVVFGGQQSYQGASNLLQLNAGIRQMHSAQPGYTGVTASSLITAGKVPRQMVSGTNIVGQWGGNIVINAANVSGGTSNGFAVAIPNVPRAECNNLITAMQDGHVIIQIGTISGSTFTATTTVKNSTATTPVMPTPSTIATACNASTSAIQFVAI